MKLFDFFKQGKQASNLITDNGIWGQKLKFSVFDNNNNHINYDYGNVYETDILESTQRLIIGTSSNQVDQILKLAETIEPPFYILYVLIINRLGHQEGRYLSPPIQTRQELEYFLTEYRAYFETDGRHSIWVGALDNSAKLIYDQHNVIFAYGMIENYLAVLKTFGFRSKKFTLPKPHSHSYHSDNDKYEDKILEHWDWEYNPLEESDVWY